MDAVNKTLYIPLYGKALVSKKGIVLNDPRAEAIWESEGFALKGKAASKWLAYYMAMRARVFDLWVEEKLRELPNAVVLHLGCGMDSRICRVAHPENTWYDVDFPEVIDQRQRYFASTDTDRMLGADVRNTAFLEKIPGDTAIVVMEGISMYLTGEERGKLLSALSSRFARVELLMDCYTEFAAKASRYKNPVNDVGVTQLYGLDDPAVLETEKLRYAGELEMTPESLICQLQGMEQRIFRKVYAGRMSKKLYRMYTFSAKKP